MWTPLFWRGLAERAAKTFAQALIAILGAGGLNLFTVPWGSALATAGLAALLSALTSFATPNTVAGVRKAPPPKSLD